MARNRHSEGAAEEHETSDGSVEEITEEDFKQDGGRGRSGGRAWTTAAASHFDLMGGYSRYINRNYASTNLYNFAWAQAVQNKPLGITGQQKQQEEEDEVFEVEDSGDEEEKEEGELEEGEIDGDDVVLHADDITHSNDIEVEDEGAVKGKEGETVPAKDTASPPNVDRKEQRELDLVVSENGLDLVSAAAEDLPAVAERKGEFSWEWGDEEEQCMNSDPEDFDQRVMAVLEKLETVTDEEVENSYKGACSRLLRSLESLQKMVLEGHHAMLEAIVQTAFDGVKTIQSAYLKKKEQNENLFARFLTYIKIQEPAVFSPEQMEEINEMMPTINVDFKDDDEHRGTSLKPLSVTSAGAGSALAVPLSSRVSRLKPLITRNHAEFGLLDPHANLDEDSLPSPTRENAQPAFNHSKPSFREYPTATQSKAIKSPEVNVSAMPSYVTDAYKAVSRYQQKYDRISFMTSNELPSPTPSEESNDHDADSYSDVSSSVSSYISTKNMKPAIQLYMIGRSSNNPTSMHSESSSGFNVGLQKASTELAHGTKLPLVKASSKSRDPRLRLASSSSPSSSETNKSTTPLSYGGMRIESHEDSTQSTRKNKISDDHSYENYSSKRQRNEVSDDSHVIAGRGRLQVGNDAGINQCVSGNGSTRGIEVEYGRWENGVAGSSGKMELDVTPKGTNIEGNHLQTTTTVPSVSLPPYVSLPTSVSSPFNFTEVAVNPLMLSHLIKEQQRLAAESQQVSVSAEVVPDSFSLIKVGAQVSSANAITMPPSPTKTAAMTPAADTGRIRMKPRDPRRVLHNNTAVRKSGMVDDRLIVRQQADQAQNSGVPSPSSSAPDISQQLTARLKNVAPVSSSPQVSQSANAASIVTLNDAKPTTVMVDDEINGRPGTADVKVLQSSTPLVSGGRSGSVAMQSADPWGDVDHLLEGYDDRQKAAIQRERVRRIEEQNKMFAARKLCLVLDLDHTLLNSAKFIEVEPLHDEILRKKEEQDREKPQRHLYRFQHMGMWTKLRPGIWNFLEKASKLYELHLYTMGNHLYATEMAKVLDPTGSLFNGRVISRGDDNEPFGGDERVPKSKDLEGVLGMESAVVIIDDSVKVWPHNRLNLIVVERYTYFPCSRRQFGLLGPSLLEIDHDERPEDGTLASSLSVIERIHQNFFAHTTLNNVDVRNILASEQRKILGGCRIVFSRIFPVGEANPHLHPLWQTAEQFGAVCTNQIDDQVTHVVANSLGTDKVNWALSTGRFVVHPGWVEASALLYRRANEQDFAVKI